MKSLFGRLLRSQGGGSGPIHTLGNRLPPFHPARSLDLSLMTVISKAKKRRSIPKVGTSVGIDLKRPRIRRGRRINEYDLALSPQHLLDRGSLPEGRRELYNLEKLKLRKLELEMEERRRQEEHERERERERFEVVLKFL